MSSDWLRTFIAYDLAPTLRRLRLPVLAIGGSLDLQAPPPGNLPAMRKALNSDWDSTGLELKSLNLSFRHARTGAPAEHSSTKETFAPKPLELFGDWTKRHDAATQHR